MISQNIEVSNEKMGNNYYKRKEKMEGKKCVELQDFLILKRIMR